jgi:hypothetical protein
MLVALNPGERFVLAIVPVGEGGFVQQPMYVRSLSTAHRTRTRARQSSSWTSSFRAVASRTEEAE